MLSHLVYERMRARFPEFVDRLEEQGLIYTRVLGEGDDPSSPIGRGWQSTFLTKDRSVAEERLAVVTLLTFIFNTTKITHFCYAFPDKIKFYGYSDCCSLLHFQI